MFESLRIRNYRVFSDLEMGDLSRINLIGGKNNSGKTSLLEAIFLLSAGGNPQFALNPNVIRWPDIGLGLAPQSFEAAWKQIFNGLDMSHPIEIKGYHSRRSKMTLDIVAERAQVTHIPFDIESRVLSEGAPDGSVLVFRYADSENPETEGRISHLAQGINVDQPTSGVPINARIVLARSGNSQEDAAILGKMRIEKQGDFLLEALQVMEPRLRSVEDNSASGTPMIWGDIGLTEMIPLRVMGEGMTRVARIVLGISGAPGGVILVDEVENGIHHSVMSKVWKAISTAAEQFDTQIFATTHSYECVEKAHEGLGVDGFRYHRLSSEDGTNQVVTYDAEALQASIDFGFEIR